MEILASSSPVGLSWHSHHHASRPLVSSCWISSAGARSSRLRRNNKNIGLSLGSRESQPWGILSLPASTPPGRKFAGGCWRLIAAASGGKNGKKGGGKAKGNPERKDDGKKNDNVWNPGLAIDGTNKAAVPNKKQVKPSVWSAEFSSGKSELRSSPSKAEKERDGGGGARGSRGRVNVVEEGLDVRRRSSSIATSNVPASGRRKNQQLNDMDNAMFLRYLSPLLSIEEETLLQPEEPVPNPVFPTFCSSASGVWRGVGATFSPITGDFEPIYLDGDKQHVYDVRVLSTVETLRTSENGKVLPPEQQSLHRKVIWSLDDSVIDDGESLVTVQGSDDDSLSSEGDVYDEVDEQGYWEDDEDTEDEADNSDWELVLADPEEIDERWEQGEEIEGFMEEIEDTGSVREDATEWKSMWDRREVLDGDWEGAALPAGESGSVSTAVQATSPAQSSTPTSVGPSYDEGFAADTPWTDVMEEDLMTLEPGLVFFEDGAYSRGPLELLADASSSSREYFNAYTCKVEQCLVAGGHRRLRIVHTVSIEEGEKIEVLRIAVYEEEWMGPCNMKSISDTGGHHLKLFSDRARHSPEDIVGKWKVFEMEALAMHPAKAASNEKLSFVFSCKETSIKRGFPAMPKLTIEEDESVDLSDFSMSWLTGNVSTYVSLGATGALTFGVGWVCDDGTRLVLERAYGEDGKLVHVNSKSEIRVRR